MAAASSLKKTTRIEEECVAKSRKTVAGRFRETWFEKDSRKAVRVCRAASGKRISAGKIGEYHHLCIVSLQSEQIMKKLAYLT